MREILLLHIGQTGLQVGHAMWELACLEHNVGKDGKRICCGEDDGIGMESLFAECSNGNFTPRALLVDLDPTVIDEVRLGFYRNLWNTSNLFSGREDAASNYARAYYSQSQTKLPEIMDRVRVMVERCESIDSFKLVYSANGGTGSGLTAALLEELACNYCKTNRLSTVIYPSPCFSDVVVEPYNATLHTAATMDCCDCVTMADNQALFHILNIHSGPNSAGFTVANRLLARLINAQCLAHRYNFMGQQKVDIGELLTNLVPYPRIHFPTMAYAPLASQMAAMYETPTVAQLIERAYDQSNQLASICVKDQPYISCALLFRGTASPYQINGAIKNLKTNNKAQFVEWCPTGFKIGINFTPPICVPSEGFPGLDSICLNMVAHNVGIRQAWECMSDHFNKLHSKKAFLHWFISEGIEESEFDEAKKNIEDIISDYAEIGKDVNDDSVPEQTQQSNVYGDAKKPQKKIGADGDVGLSKKPPRGKSRVRTRSLRKAEPRKTKLLDNISPISSTVSSVSPAPSSLSDLKLDTVAKARNKNSNCLTDPSITLRPIPRPRTRLMSYSKAVDEKLSTICSVSLEQVTKETRVEDTEEETLVFMDDWQVTEGRETPLSRMENSISMVTVDWE